MSERTKRILLIIGFTLSVVVIAYALYRAFFRSAPVTQTEEGKPTSEEGAGGLTPAQSGAPAAQKSRGGALEAALPCQSRGQS